MSEKYVNYYIETMMAKMNEAIMENISLKTNARISEEVINEVNNVNVQLKAQCEALQQGESDAVFSLQDSNAQKDITLQEYRNRISELEETNRELSLVVDENNALTNELISDRNEISRLTNQLATFQIEHAEMKSQYDNQQHQLQHLDTFRNELIAARQEIERLTSALSHSRQVTSDNDKMWQEKLAELQAKYETPIVETREISPTLKKKEAHIAAVKKKRGRVKKILNIPAEDSEHF